MSFWYLQHRVSHSMCYQVLDYFHFVLYKILQYMLKKSAYLLKYWFFDSPLNLISDSPLNFSPEKLYHTIWFIISKIDIFAEYGKITNMVPWMLSFIKVNAFQKGKKNKSQLWNWLACRIWEEFVKQILYGLGNTL